MKAKTAGAVVFHVALTGNDRWSGLAPEPAGHGQGPFRTLTRAQRAVRELLARGNPRRPVRVLLRGGTYFLDEPLVFTARDSGTASGPVTWAAYPAERVVISGGQPLTGWREDTVNGKACWSVTVPTVARGKWYCTQLFVNGERRYRARLPKHGFHHFAGLPAREAKKDTGQLFHGAMSALFNPGEIRAWRHLEDIEVVVPDHWYENHLRVRRVDEKAHTVYFATPGRSRFSRDETGKSARFCVNNVFEALTEPGEWYLERRTGKLRYIPLPHEKLNEVEIVAPRLEVLLLLAGDPRNPKGTVRHLRFEGLDFRHQEWALPATESGALQAAINVPAAVRLVGAEDCAFYACQVSRVAGYGIEVMHGSHRNRIVACALYDLGGGGVKIGHEGGLPKGWVESAFRGIDYRRLGWGPHQQEGGKAPGRDLSAGAGTSVSDCAIHDGGRLFASAIGVWVGTAAGTAFATTTSTISTTPASPAAGRGVRLRRTSRSTTSSSTITSTTSATARSATWAASTRWACSPGRSSAATLIHDVNSLRLRRLGHLSGRGQHGILIENNLVYNTKCGGFHQHYGRDNQVRNNIFAYGRENQLQISRRELVRAVVFERNIVYGAVSGALLAGGYGGGWTATDWDRNVYAQDSERPSRFAGLTWAQWQARGNDPHGRLADPLFLDPTAGELGVGNAAALRAVGFDLGQLNAAKAGPRFRDSALPATIDAWPAAKEQPRPIIEGRFWPWPAEWPDTVTRNDKYHNLPAVWQVVPGEAAPLSVTLENRGTKAGAGSFELVVTPAAAARLVGPRSARYRLKPGARQAFNTRLVATGKAKTFRVDLKPQGEGLFPSALLFAARTVMTWRREPRLTLDGVAAALRTQPGFALKTTDGTELAQFRAAVAGNSLALEVSNT